MVVTQREWDKLTEREKEILKGIGISPKSTKSSPKSLPFKGNPQEPYFLKRTVHCNLCKSITIKYFHMLLSEDSSHLYSKEATEEEAVSGKYKSQELHQSTCSECYNVLIKEWTKEEIAKALIKAYPLASIGGGKWKK